MKSTINLMTKLAVVALAAQGGFGQQVTPPKLTVRPSAISGGPARGVDEVLLWNDIMRDASLAEKTAPFVLTRSAAIVNAAIFDAINGVERQYTQIHVAPAAPAGASSRAAAVQAAYGTLIALFPTQRAVFDSKRFASLEKIAGDIGCGHCAALDDGIDWGQRVADQILAWRSGDGFATVYPPFLGGSTPGKWRPTPPALAQGVGFSLAHTTPWELTSPAQFRPGAPPALSSAQYAADFNETKTMGSAASLTRSADQTLAARFWATDTVTFYWGRVATSLTRANPRSLLENARLFARLSLVMADAVIGCWDAKYNYAFWRPVTAVVLAATDGNSATVGDPAWTPLIVTPAHPEYPSAHSTISSAAVAVLVQYFGENTTFTVDSSVLPAVHRTFSSFSSALDELEDARVFGGIHFRTSCREGRTMGQRIAAYVLSHF